MLVRNLGDLGRMGPLLPGSEQSWGMPQEILGLGQYGSPEVENVMGLGQYLEPGEMNFENTEIYGIPGKTLPSSYVPGWGGGGMFGVSDEVYGTPGGTLPSTYVPGWNNTQLFGLGQAEKSSTLMWVLGIGGGIALLGLIWCLMSKGGARGGGGMAGLGMSKQTKTFVAKKIATLIKDEGFGPKRAIAAAYSMARQKGFKVPKAPKK